MSNSTHKVEIVPIQLEPCPDSDNLSIVKVHGYQVVVNTAMWEGIELGAYLPPDSLVNTDRPEFSFLKQKNRTQERIKVKRLRGILSMGLLVPAPAGSKVGDDVAEILEVGHWEPPLIANSDDKNVGGPSLYAPHYDIDSWFRYLDLFNDGELIYATEKLHGSNMRVVYDNGKQFVGSRNYWKEESDSNIFWQAFRENSRLGELCKEYPGMVFYGECYGKVKGFRYDCDTLPRFRAFDILFGDKWLDSKLFVRFCANNGMPQVPIISYDNPLDKATIASLAEGQSLIGNHVREGIVIKPMEERYDRKLGRVLLKLVGEGYYNHK